MGLTGTISYIVVVAVSVIIVATIIILMSRTLPGKTKKAPLIREREPEKAHGLPFLRRVRSRLTSEPDEESVMSVPPLEAETEESPIPAVEPTTIPITRTAPENDAYPSPETEIPIPPVEEEAETPEISKQPQGDDGLDTFRIEIAEDDGLSRIAESLEDVDLGKLLEIAQDILSKRRKKSGR